MTITQAISYDEVVFKSVEEMPTVLVQELEIYFCISVEDIKHYLKEQLSVGEIKQLCRDIHNRTLH